MAHRRSSRFILVAAALLAAIVAAGAILVWQARTGTERGQQEAVADFRERASAAARPGGAGEGAGPAPGVYTYSQVGRESGGIGPVALTRSLPDEARLIVAPEGEGWSEELVLAEEHVEAVHLRLRAGATIETWRRSDVTFLGLGRDDRREVTPPALRLPARPAPGVTWTSRHAAGTITMALRGEVLRREPVRVGGTTVSALVVRTVTTSAGTHPGTRTDTLWWSPEHRLAVRWDIVTRVRGIARLDTRTTLRLTHLRPRV